MSTESNPVAEAPSERVGTMSLSEARRELVKRVAETITAQSFTGIVGEAEMGKTGILQAALRYLGYRGRTVIAIDLDGAWSPNRLAWRWAIELARTAIGSAAVSHLHALDRSMWPSSTRSAILGLPGVLGEETAALAQASQPPDGIGRDDVLRAPIQATLALARSRPELVVLSLDHLEAPTAAGLRSPDVAGVLWSVRAPGQHLENLRVAVATRPPAQELASGPEAAYHQLGRWLTVQPPTPEEFQQVSGVPKAWCVRALKYTGGHPSSTLEVLDELRLLLSTGRGETVPDSPEPDSYPERRVGSILDRAVRNVSERHGDLARRAVAHARTVHRFGGHLLTAVALGQGPYEATPEIAGSEIAKAMVRLHLNGLVRRTDAQRGWETTDPRVRWSLAGPANG